MKKATIKSVCSSDKIGERPIIATICFILGLIAIIAGIFVGLNETSHVYDFEHNFIRWFKFAIPFIGSGFGCIVVAQILYYLDGIYSRLYKFELEEKEEKK